MVGKLDVFMSIFSSAGCFNIGKIRNSKGVSNFLSEIKCKRLF